MRARPSWSTTPTPSHGPDHGISRRWPIRPTSRASSGSRPGSGRSMASAGRCLPPSRAASAGDPRRTGDAAPVHRRPPLRARPSSRRAGSHSACSSGRLPTETERTWQLLRRAAREAGDWITVDSLAHPYAKGIAAEPYRWAELEFARLQPVALGTPPGRLDDRDDDPCRSSARARPGGRRHGPALLADLMGDAEPDVQKALSWAYRSLTVVDRAATEPRARGRDGAGGRDRRRPSAPGSSATRSRSSIPSTAAEPPRPPGRHPQAARRPVDLDRRPRPSARFGVIARPDHLPGAPALMSDPASTDPAEPTGADRP